MNTEQPNRLERLILALSRVGLLAGLAVWTVVWRIMEDMRSSLQQAVLATNDPQKITSFEAALQYDRRMSVAFFGLTMLVAAFFTGLGIAYLRKGPKRS